MNALKKSLVVTISLLIAACATTNHDIYQTCSIHPNATYTDEEGVEHHCTDDLSPRRSTLRY